MLNCNESRRFFRNKEFTDLFKGSDCVDDFFPWRLTVRHCSHRTVTQASQITFPAMMRMSGLRDRCLNLYPSLWESSKVVCWVREYFLHGRPLMLQSHPGFPPLSNLIVLTQSIDCLSTTDLQGLITENHQNPPQYIRPHQSVSSEKINLLRKITDSADTVITTSKC